MRWVRADHLHITLKFLGDVESVQESKLIEALEETLSMAPFKFNLAGLGAFPDKKRPRVIWTAIANGAQQMTHLAGLVEQASAHAGLQAEGRGFSPHVTLGRVKQPGNLDALWTQAADNRFTGQKIDAQQIKLIWSTLTPTGPVYRDVESFPLREGSGQS